MTAPLLISSSNGEQLLGCSWRWLRDHSAELRLTVMQVGGKRFVDASAALDAINRHAAVSTPVVAEADELAALRARLGKRGRVA
ncbi:MAG TPA: hypothetical protein VGJ84_15370 [Polyangiaceae bacterium]